MVEAVNPFIGMHAAAHHVIEMLFRDLYSTEEFDDDHYDLLAQWREARGDEAKTEWRWWVGYGAAPDEYSNEHGTREAAIDAGRMEYVENGCFTIIEARQWNDDVMGEDNTQFAESRNKEIIKAYANDDVVEPVDG